MAGSAPHVDADEPDDRSKAQVAYEWLSERIASHRFGSGHRLVLRQIAGELGISVVPVREALRRLQAEGAIIYEKNIGATVAMPDESEYTDVMQTLGIVEGAATALAIPRLTAADLDRAAEINERMRQIAASVRTFDPERFTELNRDFHAVFFHVCPNAYLRGVVERCWARLSALRESTFSFIPGRAHESVAEHDEIVALLRAGAPPDQVELAARNHRLATLQAYLARQQPTLRRGTAGR